METKSDSKRARFVALSLIVFFALFFIKIVPTELKLPYFMIILGLVSLGVVWALDLFHLAKKFWFYTILLPINLMLGAMLAFYGFPNLSVILRLGASLVVSGLMYITLLVLNVYVVVGEKGKVIPLYRVATTWVQILIVVASIPLFSGIFKLSINPLFQVGLISLFSLLLNVFFLWTLDLEIGSFELKPALFPAFWVSVMAVSILFIPFEAVFRGLFLASVLLFGIGYTFNTLRHTLTKRITIEYLVITAAFLFLGLLFVP